MISALKDAVSHQFLQMTDEHPLGDVRDASTNFRRSHRPRD